MMSNREIDLTPFGIVRPEKIRWVYTPSGGDILASIPSKSLRSFLRNYEQILKENSITYTYERIDESKYLEWYEFYQKSMQELGHDIFAPKDLLNKKKQEGKSVEGILYYQDEELIAGSIIVRKGTEFASIAYKASVRLELGNQKNSSFGSILDFQFIKTMSEQGVEVISGGRSRNAFGVANSVGYLDYKLRVGYTPQIAEDTQLNTTTPINEDGFVLFFGYKDGKIFLCVVKPKGSIKIFEAERFASGEMPLLSIEYEP